MCSLHVCSRVGGVPVWARKTLTSAWLCLIDVWGRAHVHFAHHQKSGDVQFTVEVDPTLLARAGLGHGIAQTHTHNGKGGCPIGHLVTHTYSTTV